MRRPALDRGRVTDDHPALLRRVAHQLRIHPDTRIATPASLDPGHTADFVHEDAAGSALADGVRLLAHYQARLAAQNTDALLVILQGLDAAGKDGAIKHVMAGVNPQGVSVHSFKQPSVEECAHDFLWRYAKQVPARGQIGIFNRSHYEDVLVVRVHPEHLAQGQLADNTSGPDLWKRRFRDINAWERYLVDNGVRVVKIFLNISRAEQRRRLLARIDDPDRNWKFSPADIAERPFWDAYQHAYAEVLTHTSTHEAPWFAVPADHKWFARLAVAAVIVDALAEIDPHFPSLGDDARQHLAQARAQLSAEGD